MTQSASYFGAVATDQAVAGFTAGLVSTLVCHPLDVIKIRLQVDDTVNGKNRLIGRSAKVVTSLMRSDGIQGLYRGISPSVAGASVSWACYFWWYQHMKDGIRRSNGGSAPTAPQHLAASAASGAITAFFTNPLWVIKTRMCATSSSQVDAYSSMANGLSRLVREEGLRGLYRGFIPSLAGVSHGAIQWMVYEELKKWRIHENDYHVKENLSTTEYIGMSVTSKLTALILTYPYQVVRSRLQNEKDDRKYRGLTQVISKTLKSEGLIGFYKGMFPNIVRVLPGTCITFLVYEQCTRYFREHGH
ncbi:mitochondrial carrier domain-containing protein [Piptocephalis cylindrospora]|uniref:Mitochondrial carrier domain-containing protein n=1 Tax=Piptocephalis cylindrospora TaxID=1907219 RepID=A0A4P9XXY7_9FUNG|nr:mitochondrial carrier domain-containing protein [Piptocephalis cylindrospora]|eukprot:RKP11266.1 mitochondrial carrier domain-containing protein [Piptocephalis cylindrospora]